MGYHRHEIQVMIEKGQLARARKRIADVFRATGAVRQYTADHLMVDQSTLVRWVKKLDMHEMLLKIEQQAIARGTKVERRGRPLGAKDSVKRASKTKEAIS